MAFESFLNHLCDIYHVREEEVSPGYSLPGSPMYSYPETPDIPRQKCHFAVKSASISTDQTEPANFLESRIKLTLPLGTDIRINDKVVNCLSGYEYTAEQPVQVQEHHMFVYIKRKERQKEI